jgi:PTS system mannose-specific IIA component
LPMVIKAVNLRDEKPLTELAAQLETFGKRSITMASGILKGNKRS